MTVLQESFTNAKKSLIFIDEKLIKKLINVKKMWIFIINNNDKKIQIVLKTQNLLHLRKLTNQKAYKIQKKKEFIGKKV